MRPDQARKVIRRAASRPSLRRTDEFIEARLSMPDLYNLFYEMGPNCNSECFHCALNCSPQRQGLPSLDLISKSIHEAPEARIRSLVLTNGEPFREENRLIVRYLAPLSNYVPMSIVTNGIFASTLDEAVDWFTMLKSGFADYPGIGKGTKARLTVSFGKMYPVHQENYFNINQALKQVFPDLNHPDFLNYRFISLCDVRDAKKRVGEVMDTIYRVFGEGRKATMLKRNRLDYVGVYTSAHPNPFLIQITFCDPVGRAKDLPLFDKLLPVHDLVPGEMLPNTRNTEDIELRHNGYINFLDCWRDAGRDLVYGNIAYNTLSEVQSNMRRDVLFQAFKLGDTPLLYYAAQQINPKFSVNGRSGCDAALAIFKDANLVGNLREYFAAEGVGPTYKRYIYSTDLRKSQGM